MDKYKFGEFIYNKRKALGITQDELGHRLGVTNRAVSKWETGETMPEVTMLESLSKNLNISIDELLTQQDHKDNSLKKIKVNKLLIVAIILLIIANGITILLFTIKKDNSIKIDNNNYNEYLLINPLETFDCVNQSLTINSSYKVNNDYIVSQDILLTIEYTIDFYYYTGDTIGVITYYNRVVDTTINNDIVIESINVKPKNEITNFNGLKKIEISYEVINCEGFIKRR